MTAKEYLQQLEVRKCAVECKQEMVQEYRDKAMNTTATLQEIKVQTSHSRRSDVEDMSVKAADMIQAIEADTMKYYDFQHMVINQIQELSNKHYIQLLFKVYVQFKSVKIAASEMGMSYQYVRDLHKKALKAFEKIHADVLKGKGKANADGA